MTGPHPDPLEAVLAAPHEWDGKLEPEAKRVTSSQSDAALVSIAVSLKRIADRVENPDAHGELTRLFWELGEAFGRGMRS